MQRSTTNPSSLSEIKSGILTELQKSMGDMAEELLPELALMFLEDAPPAFSKINQAIIDNDALKVKELAHTLKGSSASIGLIVLAAHCQDIEDWGRAGQLDFAAAKLQQAQAEYEQVAIVLNTYTDMAHK